ncbi:thioredoxin domain-containing protein [Candidatus Gracilibacteria bacterium]|nr:thioredoxin domain-containing protein [Candidatus Gracilibacteria bacterium]
MPTVTAIPPTTTPVPPTAEATAVVMRYKGAAEGRDAQGVPTLGDPAALLLTDYSDFLGPACQRHVLTLEPLLIEQYVTVGQLQLAFRPVLNHGERSLFASEAAFCAAEQQSFWIMHELLFSRQDELWATQLSITRRGGRGMPLISALIKQPSSAVGWQMKRWR